VPEHVGAKQHLALAPLELAQVEPGAGEREHLTVEPAHLLERHEDLAAAHASHQAGHQRMLGPAQPDYHIEDAADRLALGVGNRTPH
jgi:hypothetical protein